jgi:hypothetical protein
LEESGARSVGDSVVIVAIDDEEPTFLDCTKDIIFYLI